MSTLFRQTWALTRKTLLIYPIRFAFTTWLRAFIIPIAFTAFITYSRYLFLPKNSYGIGTPMPVASLADSIDSNLKLVLVSNDLEGDVARVIQSIHNGVMAAGKTIKVLATDADLSQECKQSLRGTSNCYAAAVFYSSPNNPRGGNAQWNYTLRGDVTLGYTFDVNTHDNSVQKRLLPLQHAIDWAIAAESGERESITKDAEEYMYTKLTQKEADDKIRRNYQNTIIGGLGVSFIIAVIGVVFQLPGFIATERETGISQLIQVMGGKSASLARIISYHLAFDIIYLPGWIIAALIFGSLFSHTSRAILVFFFLLSGLSLCSMAIFAGTFFKKAQLSGSMVTLIAIGLGIVGQVFNKRLGDGAVAILGILFPPMNFLWFVIWLARFEKADRAANLLKAAPDNPWKVSGIVLWIFFVIHIIAFPLLGLLVEQWRYGITEKSRTIRTMNKDNAVEIKGFTRKYIPGFWDRRGGILAQKKKKKDTVIAVNGLNLDIRKGSVVSLLGANGCGKTTTLESVVGLGKISEGTIAVNIDRDTGKEGGIGVCPQKNVLWDVLTVQEHIAIWNKIKCDGDDKSTLQQLIKDFDLEPKRKAQAKTLSGGQKRKLQLAIAFTGESTLCAIDEVSTGLDPLSRRKIWDIILAKRGRCTIMLTTHFLDEAGLLSDHIAILSKGNLKAEGSSVELKARLGGGYKVTVVGDENAPVFPGIPDKRGHGQTTYNVPNSESTGAVVDMLEKNGNYEYHVSGPTIEDVFLKVAEDSLIEAYGPGGPPVIDEKEGVKLYPGKRLSVPMQAWWMFRKRLTILRRNYLPTLCAIAVPLLASGLTMFLVKSYKFQACSRGETLSYGELENFDLFDPDLGLQMVIGPSSRLSLEHLTKLTNLFPGASNSSTNATSGNSSIISRLSQLITVVDSYSDFQEKIKTGHGSYTPGGFFLGNHTGDQPVFAYGGAAGFLTNAGIIVQNIMDNVLFQNTSSIATGYAPFDFPWAPRQLDTLQFVIYLTIAMATFPAFFTLYPTLERLRQIRALHYSNGVRSFPLWSAYVMFDFMIVLLISTISIVIFATVAPHAWYNLAYLFVVFLLHGLASILFSYVISLVAKSQLSAFAFAAAAQDIMFVIYFNVYMNVLTYSAPANLDNTLNIAHFSMATIMPVASLLRALFVSINAFQIDCRGEHLASYPGQLTLYGGPILYLTAQSIFLFCLLLWWDSGVDRVAGGFSIFGGSSKKSRAIASEDHVSSTGDRQNEKELQDEVVRVLSMQSSPGTSSDGLSVIHLTKKFKSNVAVNNVTFGVQHSSVFALIGPNGGGKTTTINMIRGDMLPTTGDILVENISVITERAKARAHLGVCPQFDAMDQMTVLEHLKFYARIRGIPEQHVEDNVSTLVKAVGLNEYVNRMASTLSGGNKRKLSLAIALSGNPSVLLLDEPSSGMDAASKRVMWTTLRYVLPGRSLVLTTHSMEEADALADRAGILAGKILALGSIESLRRRYGDRYNVHLVLKSAPNTSEEEMDRVKSWIRNSGLPNVVFEDKSFLGQIRFSISAPALSSRTRRQSLDITEAEPRQKEGLSMLFRAIENAKEKLGVEYYYVSLIGLEDIFLKLVGESGYGEEGYGVEEKQKWWKGFSIRWGRKKPSS